MLCTVHTMSIRPVSISGCAVSHDFAKSKQKNKKTPQPSLIQIYTQKILQGTEISYKHFPIIVKTSNLYSHKLTNIQPVLA